MSHADGDYRTGLEPLDDEIEATLDVRGSIPGWLSGTLVRNGAGRWTALAGGRGERMRHWFDGAAMLHRFAFTDGRVEYANRYLRSRAYDHAQATGEIGFVEFGTVPKRSVRERLKELRSPSPYGNNASVNVVAMGGQPVALTETPEPVAFDPVTLRTLGPVSFTDDIPGPLTTAHPHVNPITGVQTNYTVEFGRRNAYHLYELAEGSVQRKCFATVPVDRPSYMHTFAMTERYAVLVEYPMVPEPLKLLLGRAPLDAYTWRPERGTRFTVVDRRTGAVVRQTWSGPMFAYHHVNAFDDGEDIVLDLPVMPGERAFSQLAMAELLGSGARTPCGELRRYRVPVDGGPITYGLLSTTPVEFPSVADGLDTRAYRFVYGLSSDELLTTSFTDRLVKIEVGNGATVRWSEPGCWPGEPVFVGRPGSVAEDDGVVLSQVLNASARRSFLLVLDASSFREVARALVPHAIPHGFHGDFFPG